MPVTLPAALTPTADVLRERQVGRMLGASLLGRLPTGMAALAVLLLVRGRGGDYALAGLLSGLYAAGQAVGGPLLGRVVDRYRQGPVLVGAAIAAGVGFAGLSVVPVTGAVWAPVAATVLAGLGTPPLESCLRVLWPQLLAGARSPAEDRSLAGDGSAEVGAPDRSPVAVREPDERLHAAYSLDAAAQEILFVVGPLLVLGAVALVGAAGGVVVAAVLGLVGVGLFASAGPARAWRPEAGVVSHPAGPLRSGRLVRVLGSLLLTGFTLGTFAVGVTAYSEQVAGRGFAGWLIAANGLGALLGGLAYTAVRPARDLSRRLVLLAGLLAVGYLPLAALPGPALMVVLCVVSGLLLPAVLASDFGVVARLAPAGTQTEAFAWTVTAFGIGNAAGSALAGTLVDASGPTAAFLAGTATAALAAVTVARRLLLAPA
jgi:MFS family permease